MMNLPSHNRIAIQGTTETSGEQIDRGCRINDDEICQMSSAEQVREGRGPGKPRSSRVLGGDCADLLHELANTTTVVLMNAQVLGWKLPPYSRLKRSVREIERNAQRAAELLKRLLCRLEPYLSVQSCLEEACAQSAARNPIAVVTSQEPVGEAAECAVNLPPDANPLPAPASSSPIQLTSGCDGRTSTPFPKGDKK